MESLAIYKNDTIASWPRRLGALALDALFLIVLSFALILASVSIVETFDSFKDSKNKIQEEMMNLYKIQEDAKVYEYVGVGEEKYNNPRELEDIFYDYCISHILYSYSVDPTPFEAYEITVENPDNIKIASYETDKLAYFYVYYVAEHNEYNGNKYDIVEMKKDPRLHFFDTYKTNAVESDMWIFNETTLEMPRLDSNYAVDLYRYLKDNKYESGLKNYNYLATNFQRLWKIEINQLTSSDRYNDHYDIYKQNYANCSYMIDAAIAITFVISFTLICGLPQILFKNCKTFGKKIMRLSVVDKEGYELLLWQKIVRNVFLFIIMFGALVPSCFLAGGTGSGWMYPLFEIGEVGISLFNIMVILLIIGLISFIVCVFTKNTTSIHDLICHTVVVDDRYHKEAEGSLEIQKELEEKELKNEKFIDFEEKKYFDSSSFENTERKSLDTTQKDNIEKE